MKLTPWFCAVTQPPVRVGNYEYHGHVRWAQRWWNGNHWCIINSQHRQVPLRLAIGDRWRGVLREDEA